MAGQFLLDVARRGRPLSGWLYLAVFGSGLHFALGLEAATSHSFSFFPSSSHVCAASEQPPFSETPGEIFFKKREIRQAVFALYITTKPRNLFFFKTTKFIKTKNMIKKRKEHKIKLQSNLMRSLI